MNSSGDMLIHESVPFLIAVSAITLLLIFVPEVVLLVPDWIFGKDQR